MKRTSAVCMMLGVLAGLPWLMQPTLAAAQTSKLIVENEGAPSTDLPMADYHAFDAFSAQHPEIIGQLSRNPQLMRSDSFLAKNPEFKTFLDSHPEVRDELREHPGNFLPLTRGGQWIARHPGVAAGAHHARMKHGAGMAASGGAKK
jgi:hypothetical protein